MIVRHLVFLKVVSICFGNLNETYIAPLIGDLQRAPLVALVNTSDIRQNILKSFKKQLNEKVDNLVKQKLKNINHRIQKLEEKWKSFEKDISTGSKKRKGKNVTPLELISVHMIIFTIKISHRFDCLQFSCYSYRPNLVINQ